MKNSKFRDIPFSVVDTRFQELAKSAAGAPRKNGGNGLPELGLTTLLLLVLHQLIISLRKPMIALKYLLFQWVKRLIPLAKRLPWVKIGLLALPISVLLLEDTQINFTSKNPVFIFSDKDDERTARAVAQNVSLTGYDNPYAPAAPMSLRDRKVRDFVKSYGAMAVEEMHFSGVPASITMAQALVESRCGESKLATKNNNYFGIKCFSKKCGKGHCTNATDDHHKDFFRKYKTVGDSFRHHSQLLTQGRYKKLHRHGNDYIKWAKGLRKVGYATDKTYDQKLIQIIESYKLYNLDKR